MKNCFKLHLLLFLFVFVGFTTKAHSQSCLGGYGSATFTKTDADCSGIASGSITIIPTLGPVGDYRYKLRYKDAYVTSNVFNNLRAGTYRGYAIDIDNCVSRTGPITIGNTNQSPGAIVSHTDVTTFGGNDGSITIAGTGGSGNYLYKLGSLGTAQTSGNFNGLKAGTYRMIVIDVAGCKQPYGTSVTIAQPSTFNSPVTKSRVSRDKNLAIYPNPSTHSFTMLFSGNNSKPMSARVMDINGKTVFATTGNTGRSVKFGENFGAGTYLVEVIQGNEVKTMKVVKER